MPSWWPRNRATSLAAVQLAAPGSHAPLSQRKKQLRGFLAGIERGWQHQSDVCTAPRQALSSSHILWIKWKERHPDFYVLERVGVTHEVISTAFYQSM